MGDKAEFWLLSVGDNQVTFFLVLPFQNSFDFFNCCLTHQHLGNAPPRSKLIQTEVNVMATHHFLAQHRYQKPLTPLKYPVQKPHVTHSRTVNGFIGSSSVLTL